MKVEVGDLIILKGKQVTHRIIYEVIYVKKQVVTDIEMTIREVFPNRGSESFVIRPKEHEIGRLGHPSRNPILKALYGKALQNRSSDRSGSP